MLGTILIVLIAIELITFLVAGWWESSVGSTLVLIALGVTGFFVNGKQIPSLPWWMWISLIFGYFLIGIIWSVWKWTWFMAKKKKEIAEKKKKFYDQYTKTDKSKIDEDWQKYVKEWNLIPKPKDYTDSIIYWIAYWPLSLFWTILKDFIRDIAKWLYERLSKLYQKITDYYFKEI